MFNLCHRINKKESELFAENIPLVKSFLCMLPLLKATGYKPASERCTKRNKLKEWESEAQYDANALK